MRRLGMLLAAVVFLGVIMPVIGQGVTQVTDPRLQAQARSFMTGVDPTKVKPPDLTKFAKPINLNNTMRKPAGMSAFNTSKVFPKISLGSWPPTLPQVSILPQSKNPFQPRVVGVNPFDAAKKKTK